MKIVIIEDEKLAAQYLIKVLKDVEDSIDIVAVLDSKKLAIQFLKQPAEIDLIFMDIELGDGPSFEIFEEVKIDIPIIFVTAYKEHAIKAFKHNSIDYLLKPIRHEELIDAIAKFKKQTLKFLNADELLQRMQVLLKVPIYPAEHKNRRIQLGIFQFEPENLLLISPTKQNVLTDKEAKLLLFLYEHRDQLIKRNEILSHLWNEIDFFNGRSMDVFVTRLRKLLAEDKNIQIESIRGMGFNFIVKTITN